MKTIDNKEPMRIYRSILSQIHGDPQLIPLIYISERIFKQLNRLINNFLPRQNKNTAIAPIDIDKSSGGKYSWHSFTLSLDGQRQGKVLKPDWHFLLDCINPYRDKSENKNFS